MKHVLITGGAGFIGSHLCDLFLSRGYAVTAVDNLLTGNERNLDQAKRSEHFQFLNWDVSKPISESSCRLIQQHGLAGILHFACPASPIDFVKIPYDILKVDSLGTIYTVDLALKYGARYVLASTSEVYGDPLVHPQKETYFGNVNPNGSRACYDEAKRFAEAYVSTAYNGTALPRALNGCIVRIFNTYGPRTRPNDGRVVPELCVQALKGEPMTIHGTGTQTRSFCFVTDLIDGIYRAYESKESAPINLGNPDERSMIDFAEVVLKLTNAKVQMKHLPAREDDPKKRCPDIGRARSVLGWEPRVSLETGLKETLDYFKTCL